MITSRASQELVDYFDKRECLQKHEKSLQSVFPLVCAAPMSRSISLKGKAFRLMIAERKINRLPAV